MLYILKPEQCQRQSSIHQGYVPEKRGTNRTQNSHLKHVQANLILCEFYLRDFTLTSLENLHHLELRDNFQFNTIWHGRSVAALILCRRQARNDVNVTQSVMCVD